RLRKSRRTSKSANRLFQSVQKKQNATIQKGSPCSGMSELNNCTLAAYSDRMTVPLAMFFKTGKFSENQPSTEISPARKKSAKSITANIRHISDGLRKMNAP